MFRHSARCTGSKGGCAAEGSRQVMILSRCFSALPAAIGRQVELQLGHLEDVILEQMLREVTVVETQRGKELERVAVGSEMAAQGLVQGGVGARPRVGECSHCHKQGHTVDNCFQKQPVTIVTACYNCR